MSSAIDNTATSRSYLDFSGLGELRGQAQQNQDKALKESAQQFEGLFIQMMMKSMRDASSSMKDEENESSARETFEGMFDKEVSLQMAKRGAMGVADFMAKAVKQQTAPPTSTLEMLQARQKGGLPLHPKEAAMPLGTAPARAMELVKPKLKPLNPSKSLNGGAL
jgi:Rod binding domain-containing protein